jgi:type II secretory pathway pseudopilin PulG
MIAHARQRTDNAAPPADRPRRRGLVSVAVLIGLIILAIICAGLLKVALARRAEVGVEERRLQAVWLAESGLERASARLAASGDYSGETWDIPAEDLGGRGPGRVVIRVERVADRADRRTVRVQADYPSGSGLRSRQSKELVLQVTPSSR